MRKWVFAPLSIAAASLWPWFWEFVRSLFYEQGSHMLSPLIGGLTPDQILHWGPSIILAIAGVLIWWDLKGRPNFWGSKPLLKLEIDSLNIEHGFRENPMKCHYLVVGSVESVDVPTVAKNWRLEITVPNGRKLEARRLQIHPNSKIGIPNGKDQPLSPDKSLSRQTSNTEITGVVEGYEWFDATPLSMEEARHDNTVLTLCAQDKFNKVSSASIRISDIKGPRIEQANTPRPGHVRRLHC